VEVSHTLAFITKIGDLMSPLIKGNLRLPS
jgi:hypothetical protein